MKEGSSRWAVLAIRVSLLAVLASGAKFATEKNTQSDSANRTLSPSLHAFGKTWEHLQGSFGPDCSCQATQQLDHTPAGSQSVPVGAPTIQKPCFTAPNAPVNQNTFVGPFGAECFKGEPITDFTVADAQRCLTHAGVFGRKSGPAIYHFGDSHGAQTIPMLAAASTLPVFSLTWMSTTPYWGKLGGLLLQPELQDLFMPGDIIVLAFDMTCPPCRPSWEHDIDIIYNYAQKKGAKMLVMGDSPFLPTPPQTCIMNLQPGQPTSCRQSLQHVQSGQAIRQKFTQMSSLPGFFFWDFLPLLCDASQNCDVYIPGSNEVMYADNSHINEFASLYLAPFLCPILKKL